MIKQLVLACLVVALGAASARADPDSDLSVKVLKVDRKDKDTSYLLLEVTNSGTQTYASTEWSCVFFDKGKPVYEEKSIVQKIPPRGRAIHREVQGYGGPGDVECRLMDASEDP